jgi:hypothetical protein
MVKRSSTIAKKFKPNQAAIDAWHAGDLWGLHAACGLAPWEFSPLPYSHIGAYGLPASEPEDPQTAMDQSWPKIKVIQDELYRVAGEPGVGAS